MPRLPTSQTFRRNRRRLRRLGVGMVFKARSALGPLGDHTPCTPTDDLHVGRSSAPLGYYRAGQGPTPTSPGGTMGSRLVIARGTGLSPRDRNADRNEQHRAALGHHLANTAWPRWAGRSGLCLHLLIAGSVSSRRGRRPRPWPSVEHGNFRRCEHPTPLTQSKVDGIVTTHGLL